MSLSYLPGTASLLEELDKKLMVLLRDGRCVGIYRLAIGNLSDILIPILTNGMISKLA